MLQKLQTCDLGPNSAFARRLSMQVFLTPKVDWCLCSISSSMQDAQAVAYKHRGVHKGTYYS